MSEQFDSPPERSGSLSCSENPTPLSRGKLTKGLAQSVTRRGALKKFGLGIAGIALASLGLAKKADARACKSDGSRCNSNDQCCSRVCAPYGEGHNHKFCFPAF